MSDIMPNKTENLEAINNRENFSGNTPRFLRILNILKNHKVVALVVIALLVIAVFSIKIFILPYQQAFGLNESGYSYQITKCWKTNPQSYWVKRSKNGDNESYVKVGKCSFQGVGAIQIKDTKLNFDELLNRNLTVSGSLIKSGLVNYYKLDSAVLKTSSPETNILSGNGQPSDNKTYDDAKAGYWEIFSKKDNSRFPTGIKLYERNELPTQTVGRWKNLLLGINLERYVGRSNGAFLGSPASAHYTLQSVIRSIRVFNIDTNETFDVSLESPIAGEIWYTKTQVIDNDFYFGVGGAFGALLDYKLPLPPQRNSRISKLPKSIGNHVTKYGNSYVGSFCYEGCTYSLFNPMTLSVKPLERYTNASNSRDSSRKEELVGIDTQGRMILNVKNISENTRNEQYFDTELIAASPLSNEGTTMTIVKATELPEKMKGYFMIDGMNKILMLGNKLAYIYNLDGGNIKEIQIGQKMVGDLSAAKAFDYYSVSKTGNAVCFVDSDTVKYAVDIENEVYLDTPPDECKKLWHEATKEEIFNELKLSDDFEFVYTPLVYKTYSVTENKQ